MGEEGIRKQSAENVVVSSLINQGEPIIGSSLPCTYIPDLRYIHESEVSEGLSDLQFTGQLHIH